MLRKLKFTFLLIAVFGSLAQMRAQPQQAPTARESFERGVKLFGEKRFDEALEAFRQSARLEPARPTVRGNIGATLFALKRYNEAVASFREAINLAPAEPSFHAGLCEALSWTKKHAEAVAECEEAVRLGGATPDARAYLALITALRAANRADEAAQKAELAAQKFSGDERILNAAAEAFTRAKNYARAAETYETLARLKPDAAFYQVKLAENLIPLERDGEAIAACRRALALEPKHPLAFYYIGKIYFELGQNEDAADAFRQAVALEERFADAFYFLGISRQRRGQIEDALAAYRQAAALAPTEFRFQLKLGEAFNQAARYEDAVAPLKRAVELNASDFYAKVALGLALFESANYEEGLIVLAEAERMKPADETVKMFTGVARSRRQSVARIEQTKRRAKENPRDVTARVLLVQTLGFNRQIKDAAPYVEEILRLKPTDPKIYTHIATVYSTAGDERRALEFHRKAIEVDPKYTGSHLGLASLYARSGQIEEAVKAFEKILEVKPDAANIMITYANLLRDNGRRREALEMYKRSLSILPTNSTDLFNAGILSAKLGDENAARQYLERLKSVDAGLAKTLARFLALPR